MQPRKPFHPDDTQGNQNYNSEQNSPDEHLFLGNGFNKYLGAHTSYEDLYSGMIRKKFLKKYLNELGIGPKNNFNFERIFYDKTEHACFLQSIFIEEVLRKTKQLNKKRDNVLDYMCRYDNVFTTNYDPFLYRKLLPYIFHSEISVRQFIEDLREVCNAILTNSQDIVKLSDLEEHVIITTARSTFRKQGKHHRKSDVEYVNAIRIINDENAVELVKSWKLNDNFRPIYKMNKYSNVSRTNNKLKYWDEKSKRLQSIFFLHGAMNIFSEKEEIVQYELSVKINWLDVINMVMSLSHNNYEKSSMIYDYHSRDKMEKIRNNQYLKHCYNKLISINGNLTIIGWSMCENDEHLIKAINNSKLKQITCYISKGYYSNGPDHLRSYQKHLIGLFREDIKVIIMCVCMLPFHDDCIGPPKSVETSNRPSIEDLS